MNRKIVEIRSDLDLVRETAARLTELLADRVDQARAELVLVEALNNAIIHGNHCNKEKKVTIEYYPDKEQLTFCIYDEARQIKQDHQARFPCLAP